ncbi:hypothetical protein LCGC14_0930630, partial [marine sediment metagenome]
MSYLIKKEEENKKSKRKYYKAYKLLTILSIASINGKSSALKRLIKKFKKICEKRNVYSYYRENSCKYYKELTIYDEFIQFHLNDIRLLENENNKSYLLNNFADRVLSLTDNHSEREYLKEVFDIFKIVLSFNTRSELKSFIEVEKDYYRLIDNPPKFIEFPKDRYYSLIHSIFLEIIGIKARETDDINLARKLLGLK